MNLNKILIPGQKYRLCPCIQQDQRDSHWQKLHDPFLGYKEKIVEVSIAKM